MTEQILPSANKLLTHAIDAIVANRPSTLPHFNGGGRWYDLPAMWRGQVVECLARLSSEVKAARLRFAKGDELRELCASEFDTRLPVEPQTAYGAVFVGRPNSGSLPPGVLVRKDDTWVKNANPNAIPTAVSAATYEVQKTIYVPQGGAVFPDFVTVPIKAVRAGAEANTPIFSTPNSPIPSNLIQPQRPFYDANFQVQGGEAAGGSSGLTDPVLVAAARAYAIGQYGPTDGAIIAGLLQNQSVRRYAYFRAGALPYAAVYVADESWASTVQWSARLSQSLSYMWIGFGCRARFGAVINQEVTIDATLALKSSDDLDDTTDIDANVRAAARAYFDDRPDWYRWRSAHLKSALGRADPRIQKCTALTVKDPTTDAAVPEPANTFAQQWSELLVHYYLATNNCNLTFIPPV